jgi:hypothetical protein
MAQEGSCFYGSSLVPAHILVISNKPLNIFSHTKDSVFFGVVARRSLRGSRNGRIRQDKSAIGDLRSGQCIAIAWLLKRRLYSGRIIFGLPEKWQLIAKHVALIHKSLVLKRQGNRILDMRPSMKL